MEFQSSRERLKKNSQSVRRSSKLPLNEECKKRPISKKEKATADIKSLIKSRQQAVYHKSGFTVSSLNETNQVAAICEESTMCRICQSTGDSLDNQQVTPCACSGSLRFVHMQCLRQWRQTKKAKGADVSCCELCKQPYNVQLLGSTDVTADRILKMQEDLRQLVRSGIYLMLLMRSWKNEMAQSSNTQPPGVSKISAANNKFNLEGMNPRITLRGESSSSSCDESSSENDEYVSRQSLKQKSKSLKSRRIKKT